MRPLCQAHPRRWSEAPAGDLRCLRDGSRRDPRARRPQEGGADGESSGQEAGGGQEGDAAEGGRQEGGNPRRSRCGGQGHPGPAPGGNARGSLAARPAAAARPAPEHVHDVVIVGAGPSGASCAYWLADAGWDVVVVEKKEFPREKTCGDGLTPRAVRQLADMDLEGALAGSHRYGGLRAFGFGRSIDMQWPEHPNFPNYGYTITRHDLDGLVAGHAEAAGATLLQGTEVTAPWSTRRPRRPARCPP